MVVYGDGLHGLAQAGEIGLNSQGRDAAQCQGAGRLLKRQKFAV